jgi:hypothetical protein
MIEAVKLKNRAKELTMVSFTPPKYHNCSRAKVQFVSEGAQLSNSCTATVCNQVKPPRSSFGHI